MGQTREIGPNERDLIAAGGLVVFDAHCHNPGGVVARVCGVAILRVVLPEWMSGKFADLVIGGVMRDMTRDIYGPSILQKWTRTILQPANFTREDPHRATGILEREIVRQSSRAREIPVDTIDRWLPGPLD